MKTFYAICLSLALSAVSAPVYAYTFYHETLGEALRKDDGFLLISGIGLTDNAPDEVQLFIQDAEIYDLRTGFAMDWESIREGDAVRVVHDNQVAFEVYVHVGEPNTADFMVVVSDNIWYSDDGCFFVTIDGKYRVTLTEDTELLDEHGFDMSWEEIVPGMEMFVWAAFVTASFPGQVVPDKIVLLR